MQACNWDSCFLLNLQRLYPWLISGSYIWIRNGVMVCCSSGRGRLCLLLAKRTWMPSPTPIASDTAFISPAWASASSSTTKTLTEEQVCILGVLVRARVSFILRWNVFKIQLLWIHFTTRLYLMSYVLLSDETAEQINISNDEKKYHACWQYLLDFQNAIIISDSSQTI